MSTQTLFQLCRTGYFGLLFMLSAWFITQGIKSEYSWFFSLVWIIPLLMPIKGIAEGNPYTYAWACFVLCLYLLHGLTLIYVEPQAFIFALIETSLLLLLVTGFSFYARLRGKELGLGLKKKSN